MARSSRFRTAEPLALTDAGDARKLRLSETVSPHLSEVFASAETTDPGGQDEPTMLRRYAIVALIALLALPAGALAAGGTHDEQSAGTGAGSAATVAPLSADEVLWLQYMREEEKLARDVYLALYAKWKRPVFSNIAASEQKHMDAVKTLLARYGIGDPAAGNGPGVFDNEKIQALSTTLMTKGALSEEDALEVGVLIEVTDIEDLGAAMLVTGLADVDRVYGHLLAGSYNHLNTFESQLALY